MSRVVIIAQIKISNERLFFHTWNNKAEDTGIFSSSAIKKICLNRINPKPLAIKSMAVMVFSNRTKKCPCQSKAIQHRKLKIDTWAQTKTTLLWRRANTRNVSFFISSWYKFTLVILFDIKILVFYYPHDLASQFL